MRVIRIATRQSPLALCQSELVSRALKKAYPDLQVDVVSMATAGDRLNSTPLIEHGGKAAFVKELEQSLLRKETDIAVHSMKDVPADLPDGFRLAAMMRRADPADALLSKRYDDLQSLPARAVIGTSSLRRQCQIKACHPEVQIKMLRGNVGTRLNRLNEGQYDAIILACAGLIRLGIEDYVRLPVEACLPAIGQGAIGIECLEDNRDVIELVGRLNDIDTNACVTAERVVSSRLGADCRMPIAAYARIDAGNMILDSVIGDIDSGRILRDSRSSSRALSEQLGVAAADALLAQGADRIIAKLKVANA